MRVARDAGPSSFPSGAREVLSLALLPLLLATSCGGGRSGDRTSAPASATRGASSSELGSYTRRITTTSADAQRAFDRGLVLAYAFNHDAAQREFLRASELDPACAMAWWGVALVNGPHINNTQVTPEKSRAAWEAVAKARSLARRATETERGLIEAVAKRYAEVPPADRRSLDEAYASAMREVWIAHPDDVDVGTLFAESMMDLRPWDLWTHDGKPQPGTEEIVSTLEKVLDLDPRHPGANHFYVHVVEASAHPERGIPAADRLRDLVPGAGHLVHMPAHIDIRVGRWADAEAANLRAIEADRVFRASSPDPGFYRIYMAHNQQFLAFTGMMQGESAVALKAAREMVASIPPDVLEEIAPLADGIVALPIEVLMRFGRWGEILDEPEPPDYLPIMRAIRHFARCASLVSLGRTEEAGRERGAFRASITTIPADAIVAKNPAKDVLAIASHVLDGEMDARAERFDEAIEHLREAARIEDGLKYDEPPDWMQPVRHTLGAVLLRAGRPADAEAAYREDLARFPENGWSLFGLARALRLEKKDDEAGEVEARFRRAWSRADVRIGSTCLCQPGV